MKKKPSLDEFRSGGSEGAVESATAPAASVAIPAVAERRANKTIRIRKAFEVKLKEDAYHRSIAEGSRVTESDIIDEALERYFSGK